MNTRKPCALCNDQAHFTHCNTHWLCANPPADFALTPTKRNQP